MTVLGIFFPSNWDLSERLICVLFFPWRKKSTKRIATQGKDPGPFLTDPIPLSCAAFLPGAKRPNARVIHGSPTVRNLGGAPSSRDRPVRGDVREIFFFLLRVSGDFRADGAPPFVRALCCPRPSAQSDSFATPMAKGSRGDGGFLKGGNEASLTWRSFGTFLSTGREKYTYQSPRQVQI